MNATRACFRFYGNEKVAYYRAHATKGAEGIEADGILASLTENPHLMHDHIKYNYCKEFLKEGRNAFSNEETTCFEEKLENLLLQAHREHKAENSRYFSKDEQNAIKKLEEYKENYFAWVDFGGCSLIEFIHQ